MKEDKKGSIPGLGDGQDVTDIDGPKDISNNSLSEEDHARIKSFCQDVEEDEDDVPATKKFRPSEENFEPLRQQSNDKPMKENVIMDTTPGTIQNTTTGGYLSVNANTNAGSVVFEAPDHDQSSLDMNAQIKFPWHANPQKA